MFLFLDTGIYLHFWVTWRCICFLIQWTGLAVEPVHVCYSWQFFKCLEQNKGFFGGSAGKESACNEGDLGSIPGLGRCPGGGHGYPLQYSWASLVAQMVKNTRAVRETWVRSLGWESPLEEGMATHSSTLAWIFPIDRGAWQTTVYEVTKNWTWLSD